MADYFGGLMGVIGGGISWILVLGDHPAVVRVELNEWFRFDEPGRYSVRVTTSRVSRMRKHGEATRHVVRLDRLESIRLFFNVVPAEPDWAAGKLRDA